MEEEIVNEEPNEEELSADENSTAQPEQPSEKEKRRLEKRENREKLREIRNILLGNIVTLDDGRLGSGSGGWVTPHGVGDGASTTLFFGVKQKRYLYSTKLKNNTQAVYKAVKAMKDIGRELSLELEPKAAACYIKSVLFRPVVLLFYETAKADGKTVLELRACCGRSPLAFLSVRRAVSRFNKALPEEIKRVK